MQNFKRGHPSPNHFFQFITRISQIQAGLESLKEASAVAQASGNIDGETIESVVNQGAEMYQFMKNTENELLKQGLSVGSSIYFTLCLLCSLLDKSDQLKNDEREAVANATHDGIDELLDFVRTQ